MTTEIEAIDRELRDLAEQRAPIADALRRAEAIEREQSEPTVAEAEAAQAKRSAVVGWLLGREPRSRVAEVEKAEAAAHRKRADAAAEAALARLGADGLRSMIEPLDREAVELQRQRNSLVAAALRVEVEAEAANYRRALLAAGHALARLRAVAEHAERRGAGPTIIGQGPIQAPAPAGIAGFDVLGRVAVRVGDDAPQWAGELVASASTARAEVATELRGKGLA